MKSCSLSSPNASIAVSSFFMNGVGKAFADDAPLESEFAIIIKSGAFIGTPTHGAVVNDNILVVFDAVHSVVSFLFDVNSHA